MNINYILYENLKEIENKEIENKKTLKKFLMKILKEKYKNKDLISINYFKKSNTFYIHLYKNYKSIENLKLSIKINIFYNEKIKSNEIYFLIKDLLRYNNYRYEIKEI